MGSNPIQETNLPNKNQVNIDMFGKGSVWKYWYEIQPRRLTFRQGEFWQFKGRFENCQVPTMIASGLGKYGVLVKWYHATLSM